MTRYRGSTVKLRAGSFGSCVETEQALLRQTMHFLTLQTQDFNPDQNISMLFVKLGDDLHQANPSTILNDWQLLAWIVVCCFGKLQVKLGDLRGHCDSIHAKNKKGEKTRRISH